MKLYALYKGDDFVDIGTSKELAKIMGVKMNTIWFYASNEWKKRSNNESWVLVEIKEDEEDE